MWAYVERWGSKIVSLVVFIVLARILEPRDLGLVAFAKLFIDYLDISAGQGLGLAIIQREKITDEHINSAFWIIVFSSALLSVLLYFVAPAVEEVFSEPGVFKKPGRAKIWLFACAFVYGEQPRF